MKESSPRSSSSRSWSSSVSAGHDACCCAEGSGGWTDGLGEGLAEHCGFVVGGIDEVVVCGGLDEEEITCL